MMQELLNSLTYEIFLLRYGDLPLPRHMMFEQGSCYKKSLPFYTCLNHYIGGNLHRNSSTTFYNLEAGGCDHLQL